MLVSTWHFEPFGEEPPQEFVPPVPANQYVIRCLATFALVTSSLFANPERNLFSISDCRSSGTMFQCSSQKTRCAHGALHGNTAQCIAIIVSVLAILTHVRSHPSLFPSGFRVRL